MRRLIIACLFVFGVGVGFSQGIFHYYTGLVLKDTTAPLTTDRLILDITYNSWLEAPEGIQTKPWSIGTNISRIYDVPFGHSGIGIGIGWGFSSHNIHHNGFFEELTDTITSGVYTNLTPYPDNYRYRKNKISINYVEIPFELRFRLNEKQKKNGKIRKIWRLYPGVKAGYLINIHTSRKDDSGKFKEYNFSDVNKLRYGATLRIGVGNVSLFGFYPLSNLFMENKGVQLSSYAAGISLMLF